MRDPVEGVDRAGLIVTGVGFDRVPAPFGPVLDAVVGDVNANGDASSLHLYGSVATGMAIAPTSDVDLLGFGMKTEQAEAVTQRLSRDFAEVCRAVDIAVAQALDLVGEGDAAYGNRVFLRHYCVHLCGPPLHVRLPAFPADRRAARGLNGDIDSHARRWRSDLESGCRPGALGRRLARKSLLATAGLVSVHDHTWTTDRRSAARRWGQIEPVWATSLNELITWSESWHEPSTAEVENALEGIVATSLTSSPARSDSGAARTSDAQNRCRALGRSEWDVQRRVRAPTRPGGADTVRLGLRRRRHSRPVTGAQAAGRCGLVPPEASHAS